MKEKWALESTSSWNSIFPQSTPTQTLWRQMRHLSGCWILPLSSFIKHTLHTWVEWLRTRRWRRHTKLGSLLTDSLQAPSSAHKSSCMVHERISDFVQALLISPTPWALEYFRQAKCHSWELHDRYAAPPWSTFFRPPKLRCCHPMNPLKPRQAIRHQRLWFPIHSHGVAF